MAPWNCHEVGKHGSFLRADFRETCPDGFSFNFVRAWAFPCILLYPIGIPLGMIALLYYFQVPKMAARKMAAGKLMEMLSLYYHQVNDSAAHSAREVASTDSPEGATTQHTPVSLEVTLDGWWKVTGDWRKCPSEVLPASILQTLLGHAWTSGEQEEAEAEGGEGQAEAGTDGQYVEEEGAGGGRQRCQWAGRPFAEAGGR